MDICGIGLHHTAPDKPQNKFLHYYFLIASHVASHTFYIVCLPLFWWLNCYQLGRIFIGAWLLCYYIGQGCKDILTLPRPTHSLVCKLERYYEEEYGMPSTHSMIALIAPCVAIWYNYNYYNECSPATYLLISLICVPIWVASIALSRLYCGVHTPADLVGGLVLGALILVFYFQIAEMWQTFLFTGPQAPFLTILIMILFLALYPAEAGWTTAYGDTAIVVGVATGIFVGNGYIGRTSDWNSPWNESHTTSLITRILVRWIFGAAFLILSRAITKFILQHTWVPLSTNSYIKKLQSYHATTSKKRDPAVVPVQAGKDNKGNKTEDTPSPSAVPYQLSPAHPIQYLDPMKIYSIEIPSKFVTYFLVGFNACYTVPQLFEWSKL